MLQHERHKMNNNNNIASNSKEADDSSPSKQQGNDTKVSNINKGPSTSSSSPWLRLKDPRVVRVSRVFGGKDRHSKVCTIRGLRDRRVRLSVPTAIQLYDLQERLGLNQPSKVVDWLLNAAKHEIDELPPLPIPPNSSNFSLISQNQMVNLSTNNSQDQPIGGGDEDPVARSSFWNADAFWRAKSKEVAREAIIKRNDQNKEENQDGAQQVSSSSAINHNSSSLPPALLNNAVLPFGSYYHLEYPSNFPLSQLGSSHGFAAAPHNTEDHVHNFNVVTAAPLPSAGSALLQPLFPQHNTSTAANSVLEIDHHPSRSQVNHFQMLSAQSLLPTAYSISHQSMIRPFHLSMTSSRLPNSGNHHQPDHEEDFPSK